MAGAVTTVCFSLVGIVYSFAIDPGVDITADVVGKV